MKTKFTKGYDYNKNRSNEILKIIRIDDDFYPKMYELQDKDGNIIAGLFYKNELQVLK